MSIPGFTHLFFSICTVSFFVMGSVAIGKLLSKSLKLHFSFVMDFSLGYGVLALLLQTLAIFGCFNKYVVSVFIIPFAIIEFISLIRNRRTFNFKFSLLDPVSILASILTALVIISEFSFPGADALAYYLAQPKLIAETSRLSMLTGYEMFSVLPTIAEIPYGVAYLFGGDHFGRTAAKLLISPIFLSIILLTYELCRRFKLSKISSSVLFASIVTSTGITFVAYDGKTDLVSTMFALSAIVLIPCSDKEAVFGKELFMTGVFAALTVIAKFSSLLILPFALGIPLAGYLYPQWRQSFKTLIPIVLGAIVVFTLGWWGRNFYLFNDPLAPLFVLNKTTPMFPIEQAWFGPEETKWILLTYPFALTFGSYPMQHGGISPLWLLLIPSLFSLSWTRKIFKEPTFLFALGGLSGVLAWMIMRPSVIAPRYILPSLIMPFFFLGLAFDEWREKNKKLSYLVLLGVLVIVYIAILQQQKVYRFEVKAYVKSIITPESKLAPLLEREKDLKNKYVAGEKILLLSYSSEFLPISGMDSFVTYKKSDKNFWEWVIENKVKYIVYDQITHGGNLVSSPPPTLKVDKIEYLRDVYYLYILKN